jgi:hypothetical protein
MAVNNLNTGVGIQPTIVDAKGDLIAATANDAVNRLAVGTNGQVLVADSGETTGLKWNNPGTVGGLVHINTTTIGSGVSAVNIDNVFSSTYTNYRIIVTSFTPVGANTNSGILLRLRAAGSDASTTNYQRNILAIQSAATVTLAVSQTSWVAGALSESYSTVAMDIFRPEKATRTLFTSVGLYAANGEMDFYGGNFTLTTQFDGFSLITSTSTFSGGTVQVFGYKE